MLAPSHRSYPLPKKKVRRCRESNGKRGVKWGAPSAEETSTKKAPPFFKEKKIAANRAGSSQNDIRRRGGVVGKKILPRIGEKT